MAEKKITQLSSIGGALAPTAVLEIAQPDDVSTGLSYRATAEGIANQASLWVPKTLSITGSASTGIVGGGTLATDRAFSFDFASIPAKTAPVIADTMLVNNSATSLPAQVTLSNFYKTISGLTELSFPSLTDDFLPIIRGADGLPYKIDISSFAIASGNVPAGGTTGQFLAKASDADYDTEWEDPSILLDALSLAGNPTGASALAVSVTLGATLAFSGTALQTGAGTGDVTWSANSFSTTIANNAVSNAKFRQSAALSVVGNATNSTANVADISAASDNQVLRRLGTALAFGSIDLSQANTVGTSILPLANGGTNAALTASNGGIAYSTATALAILAGTATAGQTLVSGSNAAPSWSTSTFPTTAAAGTVLAALTANTITATPAPVLGIPGTTIGTLTLAGNTSGSVLITPQAAAGSPTLTLPNTSGTFAASAAAPITLNTTTGEIGVTGSALTKTDDTNVTLTLGGTPTTALLAATSLTLGWTGNLAVARGGSGAGTFTTNGVLYGNGTSAFGVTSQGAANSVLTANAGAPAFSDSPTVVSLTATTTLNASGATTTLGTVSGTIDMGGATSLEVPNGSAPTVNADGEIAVDTTVADFSHGLMVYYSGEVLGVVAMPIAEFGSPSNGAVPTYNSTTDEFEMNVPAGGGDVTGPASAVEDNLASFADTSGKVIEDSGIAKANVLTTAGAKTLTGGFDTTSYNAGTKSSGTYTPDPDNGNFQHAVNGGAHTLAPPAASTTVVVQYTNNSSAGAITTSGFTQVTGDPFTTTNGDDFVCWCTNANGFSNLHVLAMQ